MQRDLLEIRAYLNPLSSVSVFEAGEIHLTIVTAGFHNSGNVAVRLANQLETVRVVVHVIQTREDDMIYFGLFICSANVRSFAISCKFHCHHLHFNYTYLLRTEKVFDIK